MISESLLTAWVRPDPETVVQEAANWAIGIPDRQERPLQGGLVVGEHKGAGAPTRQTNETDLVSEEV